MELLFGSLGDEFSVYDVAVDLAGEFERADAAEGVGIRL